MTIHDAYLKARKLILWQANRRHRDDLDAADELAAEASFLFVQKFHTFDPKIHRLEVYVKFMVRHAAHRIGKAIAKQERMAARIAAQIPTRPARVEPAPDAEDLAHAARLTDKVLASLPRLAPVLRETVRRRFGLDGRGGCTLAELGDAEGVSRQAVADRMTRALRTLREQVAATDWR